MARKCTITITFDPIDKDATEDQATSYLDVLELLQIIKEECISPSISSHNTSL